MKDNLSLERFLVTDKKATELLSHPTEKYILVKDYGKDKKLVVWQPYLPLFITPNEHTQNN